jgi:NAD(P)-dependent dehydrogenase (short-subunit alcohol dehydrogenase family)
VSFSLAGQVAIVTGGGRGLGRAYAHELASRGAAVVVNDLQVEGEPSVAEAVVAEIEAAGGTAAASHASVTDAEGAEAIVRTATEQLGRLDIVVCNAGIMRNGYIEDLTPEKLDSVLDVSIRGSFLVTRAAWPVLRANGGGRVIMVSSAGGMFAFPAISNYSAAKAGVYGLMKALANEGAEHGILVNAVLPMGGAMYSIDVAPPGHTERYPEGFVEQVGDRRTVESVAKLVAALVSPGCTISGEAFSAGYGRYARVFVGLAPGWTAPDVGAVTADDVLEHLDEIRDLEGYSVPRHIYDELDVILASVRS